MVKIIFSKTYFLSKIFQSAQNSHKVLPRTFKDNHKEILNSWLAFIFRYLSLFFMFNVNIENKYLKIKISLYCPRINTPKIIVQQFMAHTADYGQVQYRPMILQYSKILQYFKFMFNSSLWHTDSSNFTIHAWPLLQWDSRRNHELWWLKWGHR